MPAKRSNGSRNKSDDSGAAAAFTSMMNAPAANSVLLSQRMALEAARFWARRLHAYADQMETLARCSTPRDFAAAQTRFLERLREDYAQESEAVGSMILEPMQENGLDEGERA